MASLPNAANWSSDAAARRGMAARSIVAQDTCWVQDVVYSAAGTDDARAYTALLLGHHFVRIAYEGAIAVRSSNPLVGCPRLGNLLENQYAAITARARHMSKLLDDSMKTQDEVLAEIELALERMRAAFLGKASWCLRWMETDLGIFRVGNVVVGVSGPIAYRLGLDAADPQAMFGRPIADVTAEWGSTMAVLMGADLQLREPQATLNLSDIKVSKHNRRSDRYLAGRYEAIFPEKLKLLLLMIESDLNCNRLFLPQTATGHEDAVFRARVVTLYHSLTALKTVSEQHLTLNSPALRSLRTLLSDKPTQRLLSHGGKQVRNRCVHYEIQSGRIVIDTGRPFFGIIESVYPSVTFESFDMDVIEVTERLAELLNTWHVSSTRD